MTTVLEGGEGSASRPGRSLPLGKIWYPLYRRRGGPQGRSGQVWEISTAPGFDSRTVHPIEIRYNVWAIRPAVLKNDIAFQHSDIAAVSNEFITPPLYTNYTGKKGHSEDPKPVEKFPKLFAPRNFITLFTRCCHSFLFRPYKLNINLLKPTGHVMHQQV